MIPGLVADRDGDQYFLLVHFRNKDGAMQEVKFSLQEKDIQHLWKKWELG
jgi:hypothetical protein